MKKTTITCDHCGKEINRISGYTDMVIDDFINIFEVDSCAECFRELNNIVLEYTNQKSDT